MIGGPFGRLALRGADNRTFKRLAYHVLRRAPTTKDIEAFFRRFHAALEARGLTVQGITTDGSALSPEPIGAVFGAVQRECQGDGRAETTRSLHQARAA